MWKSVSPRRCEKKSFECVAVICSILFSAERLRRISWKNEIEIDAGSRWWEKEKNEKHKQNVAWFMKSRCVWINHVRVFWCCCRRIENTANEICHHPRENISLKHDRNISDVIDFICRRDLFSFVCLSTPSFADSTAAPKKAVFYFCFAFHVSRNRMKLNGSD